MKGGNSTPQVLRQARSRTRGPVPCDDVQEPAGGVRDRSSPRGWGGRRDELNHVDAVRVERLSDLGRGLKRKVWDDDPVDPRARGSFGERRKTHREDRVHVCHEDERDLRLLTDARRQADDVARTRPGTKSPLPSLLNLGTIGDGVGEGDAEL